MAQDPKTPVLAPDRLEGLVHAPDFPQDADWLNTDKPLSLAQLKGKIVLLDFWTYCCINCMHVLPDLKKLEEKYPNELVVIGIHSAKFENEKGTESIRQAILRYDIRHPVLNDHHLRVWSQYGIHSWPSLVLINPNGRIIGLQSGEGIFDLFDGIIQQAIPYFDKKGQLKRGPAPVALEAAKRTDQFLSFPGKIHADNKNNRLFIADSNHHRLLISDPDGNVIDQIGSGEQGKRDGNFEAAQFHHPQGVYAEGDKLYIADTENHLIREADLSHRTVKTILGTGEQARGIRLSGNWTGAALNSPWDLLVHDGRLYIAMAGPHQLYSADLKTLELKIHAGSGREARVDGSLREAALAQPSGITTDGKKLYFADSEVSSIRSADINPSGKVETLVGEDLFVFGDVDGPSSKARLQHPLGVVYHDGLLYIADTYNSKIKIIDPQKKTSRTLAGTGKHGAADGEFSKAAFFEPAGLAFLGNKLYVADTNNHRIRVLDPASKQVRTLTLKQEQKIKDEKADDLEERAVAVSSRKIKAGKGSLQFTVTVPEGYKLTQEAPHHLDWEAEGEGLKLTGKKRSFDGPKIHFPVSIPYEAAPGHFKIKVKSVLYYCRKDSTLCFFDQMNTEIPLESGNEGSERPEVRVPLKVRDHA